MVFRRSDFTEAILVLSLVIANLGIAIAARMPMITVTTRSSIKVKPRLSDIPPPGLRPVLPGSGGPRHRRGPLVLHYPLTSHHVRPTVLRADDDAVDTGRGAGPDVHMALGDTGGDGAVVEG